MKRPPGPKPHFLTGNIPLARNNPLQTFQGWAREFGGIFYYRALWMRVYFVVDPDLVEAVLVRNYQNLLKDRVLRNSRWFFGDGLLTNEGESWLRQRRLAAPAFHRERIASYAKIMTDYAGKMLAAWQDNNQDGETRDIHQEMMQLTLRIVVRALFNVEAEQTEKISQTMNVLMRSTTGARMLLPPQFRYLPTPGMIDFRRAVRQVDETVYGIIARRREKEMEAETDSDSGDLLSMLMQARDEKDGSRMTDKQLRDEVMTFLLAGHETTALALSWTWHLLGENREAEQKLHQELDRALSGRAPAFSDLPALPYAERVIKESMRLYPPAWAVGRAVVKEFELGGYRVPAGVTVVASPYVTQRDPRIFPEPEKFDPDRWLPEKAQKLPKFAYFPFGGGPRQCIGAAFAMMEAVLLLATIAQKFQFRAEPGHVVTPTPSFTLRPKHGIRMRLEKRTSPQVMAAIPQIIVPAPAQV